MDDFLVDLFDYNNDGELDRMEMAVAHELREELESCGRNYSEDDDDDFCFADRDDVEDALLSVGLDIDDLEFMDEDERREALEDAGLDPDDVDFY